MNYKKLIRSRALRIKIMQTLSFIPDKWMVRLQYYIKMNRSLNLKRPERYTEKLQWYKLYYRDSLMAKVVDKYNVREYIKDIGLENILNECYGIYDNPNQIDLSALPNKFVIKDTLGSGGDSVIIVKDKDQLEWSSTKLQLQEWIQSIKGKNPGREWVYDKKSNRIIIEKLIPAKEEEGGVVDYKFFCFNGKARYLYVICDRMLGEGAALGIYSVDFKRIQANRCDERELTRSIKKPDNYEQMISIAEKISNPFPHARVDLYNQNGKIIFGEVTFFDGSGYMKYKPDDFDFTLGKEFVLPEKNFE